MDMFSDGLIGVGSERALRLTGPQIGIRGRGKPS